MEFESPAFRRTIELAVHAAGRERQRARGLTSAERTACRSAVDFRARVSAGAMLRSRDIIGKGQRSVRTFHRDGPSGLGGSFQFWSTGRLRPLVMLERWSRLGLW